MSNETNHQILKKTSDILKYIRKNQHKLLNIKNNELLIKSNHLKVNYDFGRNLSFSIFNNEQAICFLIIKNYKSDDTFKNVKIITDLNEGYSIKKTIIFEFIDDRKQLNTLKFNFGTKILCK